MYTILITGGAGFIGSNLADRLLESGNKVIVIDNFNDFYDPDIKRGNIKNNLNNPEYKLYEGDLLDTGFVNRIFTENRIDKVFHLAAKAGVRPSLLDPKGYYDTNVTGTINILDAMVKNEVKDLLFASSSSVYGNNKKVPFSESDAVDNPISPYAASKKAGELICYTYHHLYKINIFAYRFFTVYGPRQRPEMAIAKFADMIINDKEITLFGDGSTSRDYTYIDDIVDGLTKSIDKVCGYEIFNLGESQVVKLKRLVEVLEEKLNKKARIKFLPLQPGDVEITFADISKSQKILGYKPVTKIEEGIEKYCNWLKSQK